MNKPLSSLHNMTITRLEAVQKQNKTVYSNLYWPSGVSNYNGTPYSIIFFFHDFLALRNMEHLA